MQNSGKQVQKKKQEEENNLKKTNKQKNESFFLHEKYEKHETMMFTVRTKEHCLRKMK